MEYALGMRDVEIRFPEFTLGPLDLDLESGRVVGLVGPNGSGKTTTMKTIVGVLNRDRGLIEVCDRPAVPDRALWKEAVGYVPDRPVFYDWMRAGAFLKLVSRFYRAWDADFAGELVARFRLDLTRRIKDLSAGNRVKLSLIAALAHRPGLALFDEPTAGLDPLVRSEVFDVLGRMMEGGDMTVLYSTHILDDLHRLADDLVFLDRGRIVVESSKDGLVDRWRRIRFQFAGDLPDLGGVFGHSRQGRVHELISADGQATRAALEQIGAEAIRPAVMSLEDISVHIMKGEGRGTLH